VAICEKKFRRVMIGIIPDNKDILTKELAL
jgi:hypothetical protein